MREPEQGIAAGIWPGDVVTERSRLERDGTPAQQRKVYLVVGPSRKPGKARVCTWSHAARGWSLPHAEPVENLVPAPEEWPQTRAARKWLAERGQSAGLLIAEQGRGKERGR